MACDHHTGGINKMNQLLQMYLEEMTEKE